VAEGVGIFLAVAQGAVEGDVGGPDADEREDGWVVGGEGCGGEGEWGEVAVDYVVAGGADFWGEQVADHGKVGREEERGEDPPFLAEARVEKRAEYERGEGFGAQPDADGAGYYACDGRFSFHFWEPHN